MEKNKITKKEVITMLLKEKAIAKNKVYTDFLENELKLLNNKKEGKKAKENNEINKAIKDKIIDVLFEAGKELTATEIMKADAELSTYTIQRISAMLKKLVDSGNVKKTVDKKQSYFSIPE